MASSEPALWTAAIGGQPEEVRRLLAAGVNIDERSRGRETALHGAVRLGFDAIVELLLEKGASVNLRTKFGGRNSALHLAVCGKHVAIVGLLLNRGAGVNDKKDDGASALHLAVRAGHLAITKLLLGKGADLVAQGRKPAFSWQTPADLASAHANPELAAAFHAEVARRAALQPGKTPPGPLLTGKTESRNICARASVVYSFSVSG